jgi:hypothetical protein
MGDARMLASSGVMPRQNIPFMEKERHMMPKVVCQQGAKKLHPYSFQKHLDHIINAD